MFGFCVTCGFWWVRVVDMEEEAAPGDKDDKVYLDDDDDDDAYLL